MKVEERGTLRCCATCDYWQGARQVKPNSYGQIFIVEDLRDPRTVGVCGCGASRYCSRNTPPIEGAFRSIQRASALLYSL